MKKILSLLALAALTIGLLGSCKKEDPKVSVTGVSLDKTTLEITVGDPDVKLTATVAPENATDKTVNWASNKAEVATVDQDGKVSAVAPGDAVITVTTTDGSKTATCTVTVKAATVPVTGVSLDKTELTITVGDQPIKLTATVAPDNATDKTVSWASNKTDVATVDQYGKVSAVAPGEAVITVTTTDGSKTATCAVTVKAAIPDGALSGKFSVSATKTVYFSQGNLYWDGSKFKFEANQYGIQNSWNASHVSHFLWSKDASVAYEEYNDAGASDSDVFFTNKEDFKVNVDGIDETGWRTLSKDEWTYLFNNHLYKWASVNGKSGYVIAPDGFAGTLSDTYADDAALATAGNLVFLPAAGGRYSINVYDVGDSGRYWSSAAYDGNSAYYVYFNSNDVYPDLNDACYRGFSVRLITECQ